MNNYTINSECGGRNIQAETIEDAKDQYSREMHFDFDVEKYPGSWYFIDENEGRVEDETACMP